MTDEANATTIPMAAEIRIRSEAGPDAEVDRGERKTPDQQVAEGDPQGHARRAEDEGLEQEDAAGRGVGHSHRLEDPDLARLLDGADGESAGDAERHRDEDEGLDHERRARLRRQTAQQLLVLVLPVDHLDAIGREADRHLGRCEHVVDLDLDCRVLVVTQAQCLADRRRVEERQAIVGGGGPEIEDAGDLEGGHAAVGNDQLQVIARLDARSFRETGPDQNLTRIE